jgi:ABC-type lipoprotein export system ATPase subunit
MTPATLVHAADVWKVYRRDQELVEALRGVSLDLPEGAFAVIVGPSGGGKSTLLHLLGGMDRPTRGELFICGMALEKASEASLTRFRRDNIGFIFQFYNLIPSLSAAENVALPLIAQGVNRSAGVRQAGKLLAQVGIDHRLGHKPFQLSGGEQQRVAIARAIAGRARLVLADEPTGDLDAASADVVIQIMLKLNQENGITFLIATHNPLLSRYATHLFELHNGMMSAR